MFSQVFTTLFLGFLLGIKHAFDPDHIIAVSTMASVDSHPLKAAFVGTFWGMGHTTTLFLTGVFIVIFKLTIPDKVALSFEFLVGVVLVILGIQIVWRFKKKNIHIHAHNHEGDKHIHFHSHEKKNHNHHGTSYHRKSFFIGLIHGLAGSAALMLLVLSTIHSSLAALFYIITFGLGSILGMAVISIFISLPLMVTSSRFSFLGRYINLTAGITSIFLGFFIMGEIGFVEGLF